MPLTHLVLHEGPVHVVVWAVGEALQRGAEVEAAILQRVRLVERG